MKLLILIPAYNEQGAVGSVVDGKAAAWQDIEAPGRFDVQVGGRLAARRVFSRDDGCERYG